MTTPFWISAFLDLPATSFEPTTRFWSDVTGYRISPPRGEHREFATLEPEMGGDYLKVQRLATGGPRIHLDIHVPDPRSAADRALTLGAEEVADNGYVVMTSPGGLTFCFVSHPTSPRPEPTAWPDGTTSLLDQVCLDIPSSSYDEECGFWSAITGWDHLSHAMPEFSSLRRPHEMPLRLLLQRLDEPVGAVRAHLDLAADDRQAEVRRHAVLGAELLAEHGEWTVLRDPAGSSYCITDRSPAG